MTRSGPHRQRRRRSTTRLVAVPAIASLSLLTVGAGTAFAATNDPVPPPPTPPPPTSVEPAALGVAARAPVVPIFEIPPEGRPIPARALAAYQRSESIIGKAAPDCALDWQLLAAIAGVLTDHGEADGAHAIDDDGTIQPSIIGPPLQAIDGGGIGDTDGGLLDDDPFGDHTVGPFLFDPAVWTVVGVDADGDGRRDPQHIDDAALAASVLLCAGEDDLSQVADTRTALARFGIVEETADQVLTTAKEFRDGLHQPIPAAPLTVAPAVQVAPTPPPHDAVAIGTDAPTAPPATDDSTKDATGKLNATATGITTDTGKAEANDAGALPTSTAANDDASDSTAEETEPSVPPTENPPTENPPTESTPPETQSTEPPTETAQTEPEPAEVPSAEASNTVEEGDIEVTEESGEAST